MKLPNVLYARVVQENDEAYIIAYPNLADCVEDGQVCEVGTYRLQGNTAKYEKVVSKRD